MDSKELWWQRVTGPRNMVDDTVLGTLQRKNILLVLPDNAPWKEEFLQQVKDGTRAQYHEANFEHIRIRGKTPPSEQIKRHIKKSDLINYRPAPGSTIASYLGRNECAGMFEKTFIVHCEDERDIEEWVSFADEYLRAGGAGGASFVIVVRALAKVPKQMKIIIYDKYVSRYDVYTFCAMLSASSGCPEELKFYLTEALSSVCGSHLEVMSHLAVEWKFFMADPVRAFIAYVKDIEDPDKVKHRLWMAQIRVLFPLEEEALAALIDKYKYNLTVLIRNREEPFLRPSGEPVEDPHDIEIGLLWYLKEKGFIQCSVRDMRSIDLCREVRNTLAHTECVDYQKTYEFLKTKGDLYA